MKIFKIILFAFMAAVMVLNFNISKKAELKMEFAVENIEALSKNDDGGPLPPACNIITYWRTGR